MSRFHSSFLDKLKEKDEGRYSNDIFLKSNTISFSLLSPLRSLIWDSTYPIIGKWNFFFKNPFFLSPVQCLCDGNSSFPAAAIRATRKAPGNWFWCKWETFWGKRYGEKRIERGVVRCSLKHFIMQLKASLAKFTGITWWNNLYVSYIKSQKKTWCEYCVLIICFILCLLMHDILLSWELANQFAIKAQCRLGSYYILVTWQ